MLVIYLISQFTSFNNKSGKYCSSNCINYFNRLFILSYLRFKIKNKSDYNNMIVDNSGSEGRKG